MKYTTQPNRGKVTNYAKWPDEAPMHVMTNIDPVQKTDPSVRLGPLRGEPNGCVPIERTMAKPQAYKEKAGPR